MGLSRAGWHKRRATGGKRAKPHDKRKYELARPSSNTKLAPHRVHSVRVFGGKQKQRGLRLDTGCFAWPSEAQTRTARIVDVVYNASNNELVRTKTLTKGTIVTIDATPYRQLYEKLYALPIPMKKGTRTAEEEQAITDAQKDENGKLPLKIHLRRRLAGLDPNVAQQFLGGRLMACIASRPGQVGRVDGYILEGKELEFYQRKLKSKKQK